MDFQRHAMGKSSAACHPGTDHTHAALESHHCGDLHTCSRARPLLAGCCSTICSTSERPLTRSPSSKCTLHKLKASVFHCFLASNVSTQLLLCLSEDNLVQVELIVQTGG
jgi:hypothetical protein